MKSSSSERYSTRSAIVTAISWMFSIASCMRVEASVAGEGLGRSSDDEIVSLQLIHAQKGARS